MVEEAISVMTEEIKRKNENDPSESRLTYDGAPEILSLVVLWNDLYGRIMYKLPVPEKGDPVYRLFCERISEHGYAGVREGIIRVGQSKYLLGRKGLPPIAITSLLKPQIFSKVLTGFYSDHAGVRPAKRVISEKKVIPAPPAPEKRGLEHNVDLDAWLIDQIVHKKLHDLPPAPEDCTDWEAYMS